MFFFVENVGDKHLPNSEHAPPARISVIVSAIENLFNVGSVGHQNVFLRLFVFVLKGMLFFGRKIRFHVFYYGLHEKIISIFGTENEEDKKSGSGNKK